MRGRQRYHLTVTSHMSAFFIAKEAHGVGH